MASLTKPSSPANQAQKAETPMMRQYNEIKAHHQDAILFFRLGDFYEMFQKDATIASKELELTLTGRGKDENRIPMCGIPFHAADNYIPRLVQRGYKVAICEQVEDASDSKGITKREVVKVITPGTLLEQNHLNEKDNNYLVAIYPIQKSKSFGLSSIDISTGEYTIHICHDSTDIQSQCERLQAKEILIPQECDDTTTEILDQLEAITTTNYYPVEPKSASEKLLNHFNIQSLSAFGISEYESALPAAWAILDYVKSTQKNKILQITKLAPLLAEDTLYMDTTTIRNLELTTSIHQATQSLKESKKSTLFSVLNATKTACGARKLKQWIKSPLLNTNHINDRLDAVESLNNDILSREEIRECLNQTYDLERLVSRTVSDHHNPRDLIALKNTLIALSEFPNILSHLSGSLLEGFSQFFNTYNSPKSIYQTIINLIDTAIVDDPPNTISQGNIIKDSFNKELDDLLASFKFIKDWIQTLEQRERESTEIKSLKVGFNKVFGYYIEIPNSNRDKAPSHYIRKQTLTNAERYVTPELKEKETILLTGEDKQKALEAKIYQSVIISIKENIIALQELADIIAQLDTLQSLATVSQRNNYIRPSFSEPTTNTLTIKAGRHPVLEKHPDTHFIPNDIAMTKSDNQFILLTGPNMAGKSTIMRQIALIIIMAQMGCFVPADSCELSIVDKLFTRIGALDNLYSGQSTFMVEMLETSNILNNATSQSMIILDEIGRGTATYDGMSIACAITEHIHTQINARTLFATHYHELTSLSDKYDSLQNYNMQITESNGSLVFNYKLISGPADKSYGIHVAQMAGLPDSVIKNATKLLTGFERQGGNYLKTTTPANQLSLFE